MHWLYHMPGPVTGDTSAAVQCTQRMGETFRVTRKREVWPVLRIPSILTIRSNRIRDRFAGIRILKKWVPDSTNNQQHRM